MKRRPVKLQIDTLAVGSQQPVGLGSVQSSVHHHLQKHLEGDAKLDNRDSINIPEIRVRAHPNMGIDALGEHVAAEIARRLADGE